MKALIGAILAALGDKLGPAVISICNVILQVLKYLNNDRKDKKEEQKKTEKERKKQKIDDICDNGTIKDLINS